MIRLLTINIMLYTQRIMMVFSEGNQSAAQADNRWKIVFNEIILSNKNLALNFKMKLKVFFYINFQAAYFFEVYKYFTYKKNCISVYVARLRWSILKENWMTGGVKEYQKENNLGNFSRCLITKQRVCKTFNYMIGWHCKYQKDSIVSLTL